MSEANSKKIFLVFSLIVMTIGLFLNLLKWKSGI